MRILLVSGSRARMPDPVYPLGPAMVGTALRRAGHDVRWFDALRHADPSAALATALDESAPEAVLLSIRNIDNAAFPSPSRHFEDHLALAQAIREGRRIPASSARARHIRYLGKLLAADPQGAAVLDAALTEDRAAHAQEVARLHRVEQWRDRLLAEGDAALTELVARHPAVDGAAVRDLVRQAGRDEGTPRHAGTVRRLFRVLRSALAGEVSGDA